MGAMAATTTRYVDDALWVRGLEDDARRVIEAIPVARRAWWDTIILVEEAPHLPPRGFWVYLLFRKGQAIIGVPMDEHFLRDADMAVFGPYVEQNARRQYDRDRAQIDAQAHASV